MKHTTFLKKIFCPVLALVLALSVLTGCGSSAPASSAPAPSNAEPAPAAEPAKDLREINVVLDWYPNALHTFLYTAIERGYFAEEGLDVKIRFPANDNDALYLVSAGKA